MATTRIDKMKKMMVRMDKLLDIIGYCQCLCDCMCIHQNRQSSWLRMRKRWWASWVSAHFQQQRSEITCVFYARNQWPFLWSQRKQRANWHTDKQKH